MASILSRFQDGEAHALLSSLFTFLPLRLHLDAGTGYGSGSLLFHWKRVRGSVSQMALPGGQSNVSALGFGVGLNASTCRRAPRWRSFDLEQAALVQLPCRQRLLATTPVCFHCALAFYDVTASWIMASNCSASMVAHFLVVNRKHVSFYDPGAGSIQMSSQ